MLVLTATGFKLIGTNYQSLYRPKTRGWERNFNTLIPLLHVLAHVWNTPLERPILVGSSLVENNPQS